MNKILKDISFEELLKTVEGFDHYFSLDEMTRHTQSLKGKAKK